MIERSPCGSGGCITCPFSESEEANNLQNLACLPTAHEIIKLKEKSTHNWACHYNDNQMCGGFATHIKHERPDLNHKIGNLISYETWYREGEEVAIQQAENQK